MTFLDIDFLNSAAFMHMQGSVSMFTAAKLVSTFERHLEDRAQLICSDKLLNHATIQRLVIFWYQIPGEQLGCCDAFVNLRPIWESEDALDAFLKKESRDDSSTSGRQGTRGWFPRVFNMRAMKHKCADFDHCRWSLTQDGNFTCRILRDGINDRKSKSAMEPSRKQGPQSVMEASQVQLFPQEQLSQSAVGVSQEQESRAPSPNGASALVNGASALVHTEEMRSDSVETVSLEDETGDYYTETDSLGNTQEDRELLVRLSNGATGTWHSLIRRSIRMKASDAAALDLGSGGTLDPSELACSLGKQHEMDELCGIVLWRHNKKHFNVYFYHQTDQTRFSDAIQLRFSQDVVRAHLIQGGKVDWADPALADCLGGMEFEVGPPLPPPEDQAVHRGDTAPFQSSDEDRLRATKVGLQNMSMATLCPSKEDMNPNAKMGHSNHLECVNFNCGTTLDLEVYWEHGEGPISTTDQIIKLILLADEHDEEFPCRLKIDNACSVLLHLLSCQRDLAFGHDCVHEPRWAVFLLLALDIHCETFHHPNHKEAFCQHFLDPLQRGMPPGSNDQASEQLWGSRLTPSMGSLVHRNESRFMFVLLSLIMLNDMWREATPVRERDARSFKRAGYGMYQYRHVQNASQMRKRYAEQNRAGLAALEGQRRQYHSAARLPVKSARQVQKSQGRLQLPDFLFKEWPRGFDSRLSAQWGGKPAHSTVPVSWFRENEAELVEIIKRHIGNGLTTPGGYSCSKISSKDGAPGLDG